MPKRSIQWKMHLMMHIRLLCLLLFSAQVFSEEEVELPIDYQITAPKGYYYGTVDGETAYQDWRRGTFDQERMVEVIPRDLPNNLPEPLVIPYAPPKVNEVPAGKDKKPPLKGEDKIFVQIGKDEKKARCLLLGQGCEELVKPKRKDSVYFRPILEQEKKREIIRP